MKEQPLPKCKVSIIIPAFNEAESIPKIIERILETNKDYEIIVVDDGSEDATAEMAEQAGAQVIRNPYNIGNGASVKTGCLAATGDIIVLMDADGQHPPEEVPKLIEQIGEYDMCIGARTHLSQTSKVRNFGNSVLNKLGGWITGTKIDDLTSGFRAIKRQALYEYIHLFPRRYSYPTTITIAMILGNHFVTYVPLDKITKRTQGQSNIRPVHDFIRFVNIMLRILVTFNPSRFFLPLSFVFFLSGTLLSLYQIHGTGGIQSGGLMLLISSIIFFCFGLLADQLALIRRSKNENIS